MDGWLIEVKLSTNLWLKCKSDMFRKAWNQSNVCSRKSSILICWSSTGDDELGVRLRAQEQLFVVRIGWQVAGKEVPYLLYPTVLSYLHAHCMPFCCITVDDKCISIALLFSVHAEDLSTGTELLPPYKVSVLWDGVLSGLSCCRFANNCLWSSLDPDSESQWLVFSYSSGCFRLQPQRQAGT